MKKIAFCTLSLLLAFAASANDCPTRNAKQLIVSIVKNSKEISTQIARFERSSIDAPWVRLESTPIRGVIGLRGLISASAKREGDKKSPAGIFRLGTAFGYDPANKVDVTGIEYNSVSSNSMCIEDPNSRFYNQIIFDVRGVKQDWPQTDTKESMKRSDPLFEMGMHVLHNPNNTPGNGSCIFLHVWREPHLGTLGCTAMALSDLKTVLSWLKRSENPLFVQLSAKEYEQKKEAWCLPQ